MGYLPYQLVSRNSSINRTVQQLIYLYTFLNRIQIRIRKLCFCSFCASLKFVRNTNGKVTLMLESFCSHHSSCHGGGQQKTDNMDVGDCLIQTEKYLKNIWQPFKVQYSNCSFGDSQLTHVYDHYDFSMSLCSITQGLNHTKHKHIAQGSCFHAFSIKQVFLLRPKCMCVGKFRCIHIIYMCYYYAS